MLKSNSFPCASGLTSACFPPAPHKNDFCKLIRVKETQVLIVKSYDPEEDFYKIEQIVDVYGVKITVTLGFKKERDQVIGFREYDCAKAGKFLRAIRKMLKENP